MPPVTNNKRDLIIELGDRVRANSLMGLKCLTTFGPDIRYAANFRPGFHLGIGPFCLRRP